MTDYEAVCIFKANITEEKVTALLSRFEKKIVDAGGEFVKTDKLGQKRLPFRLNKHKTEKDGLYFLIKFKGEGNTSTILRDDFRIQEDVIRYMIAKTPASEQVLIEEPSAIEIKDDLPAEADSVKDGISGQPQ